MTLAAVAVSDKGMQTLPGEQIDAGQQVERAMAFVLMIAREGRMDARLGAQSGAVVAMAWIPGFSS